MYSVKALTTPYVTAYESLYYKIINGDGEDVCFFKECGAANKVKFILTFEERINSLFEYGRVKSRRII